MGKLGVLVRKGGIWVVLLGEVWSFANQALLFGGHDGRRSRVIKFSQGVKFTGVRRVKWARELGADASSNPWRRHGFVRCKNVVRLYQVRIIKPTFFSCLLGCCGPTKKEVNQNPPREGRPLPFFLGAGIGGAGAGDLSGGPTTAVSHQQRHRSEETHLP